MTSRNGRHCFGPIRLHEIARWDPLTCMVHSLQARLFSAGPARGLAATRRSSRPLRFAAGIAGTLAMRCGLNH